MTMNDCWVPEPPNGDKAVEAADDGFRMAPAEDLPAPPPPLLPVRPQPALPTPEAEVQVGVVGLMVVVGLTAAIFAVGRHVAAKNYAFLLGLLTLGVLCQVSFSSKYSAIS